MVNLAIKGHPTRGKEVIEILEMLGGTNRENCWGVFETRLYLINAFGDIEDRSLRDNSNYQIYTLEEFLKKFPYKVGDKVLINNEICTITRTIWDISRVLYKVNNNDYDIFVVEQLQPYKEKVMAKANKDNQQVVPMSMLKKKN